MTHQRKLIDYTVEELDRELVARGAAVPDDKRFEFVDRDGTPERHEIMEQVKEFYDAAASGARDEELSRFSIQELLDVLLMKTRRIKDKLRGIWVVDDRKDTFEITDEQLLKNANCTALICRENNLSAMKSGGSTLRVKNYGKSYNLCESEPFRQQPVISGWLCTGFLVKDDIIATACHCIKEKNVRDLRIVFGYHMADSQQALNQIPAENIYAGKEIIGRNYIGKNAEPEWALVKLDRKVKGQEVAVLSRDDLFYGQQVYVIGYPLGLPLKVAPGAQVCDISKTCFAATLDIYSGNSGSPVFCSDTHEVIGIVVRGDTRDFRWTGKGWISIVYPNLRQITQGPQCTRVSEFIAIVDNL